MEEDILNLARQLNFLYEEAYRIYEQQCRMIIKNKIQDTDYIEHMLDYVMDIYTEKGFNLFLELCSYYSTINYRAALNYLKILQEQRKEECDEYMKNYQKSKKKHL